MGTKIEEKRDNIIFKKLPSVDALLHTGGIEALLQEHPRSFVLRATREVLDTIRADLKERVRKNQDTFIPEEAEIITTIAQRVKSLAQPGLRQVINATGIILHTGVGRAVLSGSAVKALQQMGGFINVQADLNTGKRSQRDAPVERLLCELTGSEAATVVNNNAAATMIVLNSLAAGKEVIVSRGQLIEIGGSFRLPEMMATSGAIMKEIGTTNRTHLGDYENAISENTGLIFRAHPSNYRISGFTTEPTIEELVTLGKKHGVPVVDDLGAGALIDFSPFGFHNEPLVQRSIIAGADAVLFSGDKLLGGPQSGIILGSAPFIARIRKNPLARILRVCKLTLCALEATLFLYFDYDRLIREMPTFIMLSRTVETLDARAKDLAEKLRKKAPGFSFTVEDDVSYMGSGSLPMEDIKTRVIAVSCKKIDCDTLSQSLRMRDFPIFARIRDNKVIMDLRTILDGEEHAIIEAFEDEEKKLGKKKSKER